MNKHVYEIDQKLFIRTLYISKLLSSFQLRGWQGVQYVSRDKDKNVVGDS